MRGDHEMNNRTDVPAGGANGSRSRTAPRAGTGFRLRGAQGVAGRAMPPSGPPLSKHPPSEGGCFYTNFTRCSRVPILRVRPLSGLQEILEHFEIFDDVRNLGKICTSSSSLLDFGTTAPRAGEDVAGVAGEPAGVAGEDVVSGGAVTGVGATLGDAVSVVADGVSTPPTTTVDVETTSGGVDATPDNATDDVTFGTFAGKDVFVRLDPFVTSNRREGAGSRAPDSGAGSRAPEFASVDACKSADILPT